MINGNKFKRIGCLLIPLSVIAAGLVIWYIRWGAGLTSLFASLIIGVAFSISLMIITLGSRVERMNKKEESTLSDKPPVLYLRCFNSDKTDKPVSSQRIRWTTTGFVTNEYLLAKSLENIGPFIALGRPGEKIAPLGGQRIYRDDSMWRDTVSQLISKAQLVIIRADLPLNGLRWEIKEVVNLINPERFLLFLPYSFKFTELSRQKKYKEFYTAASNFFPAGLPDKVDDNLFFAFNDRWEVIKISITWRLSDNPYMLDTFTANILTCILREFRHVSLRLSRIPVLILWGIGFWLLVYFIGWAAFQL